MSPARQLLRCAVLVGSLLTCAGCDTDFSPGWEEQLQLMDAGAMPAPPPPPGPSEDAGALDAQQPEPPAPDAATPQRLLLTCVARWRCDRLEPTCQPLCIAMSAEIEGCLPTAPCNAYGYSPVACRYCAMNPLK